MAKEGMTSQEIYAMRYSIKLGQQLSINNGAHLIQWVTEHKKVHEIVVLLDLENQYPGLSPHTLQAAVKYACSGYDGQIENCDTQPYEGAVPEELLKERNLFSHQERGRAAARGPNSASRWNESRYDALLRDRFSQDRPLINTDELTVLDQLLANPAFQHQRGARVGHPHMQKIIDKLNELCYHGKPVRTYDDVRYMMSELIYEMIDDADMPDSSSALEE